ncbi:MAG: glycosyltransferase family 39 protein [Candidatus Moranbacteria bacterium]|jgi:4-amino-4-deoxy-L-arabinose transferase-like glycosyltransferase|nr:glycosyltransferase family 39 protein [Candidatus Moranbacteria bacterium]
MKNKQSTILIILAGLILLGLFLRVYAINIAPPGIYPDEAVNGQDALRFLDGAGWQWFYPDNDGREGFFINLVALSFSIFGVSAFSLRLPAIIFGTLTILGTYLLARVLFKNEKIALLAGFLNAVSFGAIIFSRISFRASMLPFILVWSFYFFFVGIQSRKIIHFAIAGAIFGLGMHSYIAFRVAPLILLGLLPFLFVSKDEFLKNFWKQILAFVFSFVIISAPMFFTFYSHPEYFWSRTEAVSVFSSRSSGHPLEVLVHNFELSLLKYNFVGDMNWRDNFPPYPILNLVEGIFFLGGLIGSLVIFFRFLFLRIFRKIKSENLVICAFLLLWFFGMLAPEFMSAEGNPHALRSIGALPVVFIFSAAFAVFLQENLEKFSKFRKKTIYGFFIVIFLFIGVFDIAKYFVFWANNAQTARAFEKNVTDLAYYTEGLPKEKKVYAILGNMQRVVVRIFNWNRLNFHDLNPVELDGFDFGNDGNRVFVFTDYKKDEIIEKLSERFGKMEMKKITDKNGLEYYVLQE